MFGSWFIYNTLASSRVGRVGVLGLLGQRIYLI